jgi:hypothetical protein
VEGSCEYIEVSSRGQPASGGPPAWGLDEGLTTPHRKEIACYEMLHRTAELTGPL